MPERVSARSAGLGRRSNRVEFASTRHLRDHFQKHGAALGCATSLSYEQRADGFFSGTVSGAVLECVRPGGDVVRYNQTTHEFGVMHANGCVATFMRLTGTVAQNLAYFQAQCSRTAFP